MAQTHFTNLLIVVVVAFAAPFALGLAPRLHLPAVVLEIVVGIAIGPSGLGWVQIDESVQILALIGLAFLLFLFFSGHGSTDTTGKLILLGLFAVLVAVIGLAIRGFERSDRLSGVLSSLQDTTAQIRVRGAFLLLIGFVALAEQVGLETILGAFTAGALLSLAVRGSRRCSIAPRSVAGRRRSPDCCSPPRSRSSSPRRRSASRSASSPSRQPQG
jgi:Kef-type K+ transport system membrane component KefB